MNPLHVAKPSDEVLQFVAELRRQDMAHKALVNYRSDLLRFADWFTGSRGEAFTAAAVTPVIVKIILSRVIP